MGDATALELVRGLYDYHWWANRRLFDHAVTLGEEAAGREVGKQFSFPTVRRMFGHLHGADWVWLARWKGTSPDRLPGAEFQTLAELRPRWDETEQEQRGFIQALTPADLGRVIAYKSTDGKPYQLILWPLLQHVANHATHHRSEIATMITMIQGSPPDTGIATYQLFVSNQGDMSRRWA
ncbi:MAG: DinB family protein [Candidatus Rokuibacteriota bacterium]